jgi:hypothetical protein
MEISEEYQNCKIVQIYVFAKKKILNIIRERDSAIRD